MSTVETINIDIIKNKEKLFAKDTISNLNKQILDKFNLTEINKDDKKKIIDLLIKNMKIVYKSIDLKKITSKNFQSIFNQYNKLCLEQTSNDISKSEILNILKSNSSQLKFERDFKSNPNDGNKLMDRPRGVSNRTQNSSQYLYPPNSGNINPNNLDPKFDKLFKPIVESIDDNYKFNNYQHGKGGEDFSKRVEQFMNEREVETTITKRPTTPDFLKPVKTSNKSEMQENKNLNSMSGNKPMQIQTRKGGKPDFSKPIPEEDNNNSFLSLNENENDLYNINNIDNPIELVDIEEDSRPFAQRLQSLESERNNISIPQSSGKINFQDPNLVINDDIIPNYQPKTIEDIKKGKTIEKNQGVPESIRKVAINEPIHKLAQETVLRPKQEPYIRQELDSRQKLEIEELSRDNSIRMNKNPQINMKKIQNTLKQMGLMENPEITELKKENEALRRKLIENKEYSDDNNKFDSLKKELAIDFQKLNEKEIQINQREEQMKLLLKKYNYLYGVRHVQMDITPNVPVNDYTFDFNQINNVIGIKLMSYSVPQPRYNIEENKNNIFKIESSQSTKEFKLNSGKYKIEDILSILESKSNLHFELNYEQKVEISTKKKSNDENTDETFDIVPTILSKEILGFVNSCTSKNKYVADKTWDLRIEDKIYLYINNIDDNIPFGVLYLGNQAVQQFRFEEPISLNKLELHFKDTKGRPFNFYGLTYSINIQLEINDPDENLLTLD